MENKWLYLNPDMFATMMAIWGFPPEDIPGILEQYPQGIYFRWVEVGQ